MKEHLFRCLMRIKILKDSVHIMSGERWSHGEKKTNQKHSSLCVPPWSVYSLGAAPPSCWSFQFSPPSPEWRSVQALLGSLHLPNTWWKFIKEKTGKYNTSSVSKVQLRVSVKKLMVLSEFNVTVWSRIILEVWTVSNYYAFWCVVLLV